MRADAHRPHNLARVGKAKEDCMAAPRRFRWGFVALGVVLVALIAWLILGQKKPAKPAKAPGVAVSVAKVTAQDVPVVVTAIGAAQAWQGVVINAQVNGKLLYVAKEGVDVKAGDLLAEIDSAAYRAVLLQAQGTLKRDEALLAAARVDLTRYQTLNAQDSIARQQVDTQAALVKQDEGTVLTDQGAVAAAQVNVNYCRITSPISGRVGVRLVDPGNIVAPSASATTGAVAPSSSSASGIVSVNQITPIAVTFTVPQGDFQRLSDVSNGFSKPLGTEALSQDTGESLGMGELSIADNHVDSSTGTVALKARFENGSRHLWPGQFVNIRLTLQTLSQATTVPVAAVNQGPKGAYVYVVGADGKAALRPITVLTTQDSNAVIKSGLKPGETVVIDGQMSLKAGSKVAIHPAGPAKKPAA
jgi:multidrug efflux system membrane fusion protein